MGLKSFYLAVNCHFFFAGLCPAHTPLGATAPPRPPELGPVARAAPQNVKLGYRQKSPLAVRPQKKQRFKDTRPKTNFGESGLLENEPTVPAEQAHTTLRQ